ncbi:MAG: DNA cytosine methyltransferase [Fusobacteriaceae bacterium]
MKILKCVAVDLFCGVGGLTYGVQKSGIEVIAGIDIDESCRFAYEKNNGSIFINKDITSISSSELNLLYPKNSIKILMGCAPCQPFSKYTDRYRKNGHQDEKWKLLYSFSNLVEGILPDIISMENVAALPKTDVFNDFIKKLEELGYYVSFDIVNSASYGVPQNRKRLVLLASRFGKIILVPPFTSPNKYPTVRQAIGHLPPLKHGDFSAKDLLHRCAKLSKMNIARIRQSKPGGTWRDWDEKLRLKCHKKSSGKSYSSVYGRMCWDAPAPTITTQFFGYGNGRFGHPDQERALSLREGAILQSFPENYLFLDQEKNLNTRNIGMHIGNAVPVELGHAVGLSILNHLKREGKL